MNFYDRYKYLCDMKGLSPQSKKIMSEIGVTSGTITGWSNGSKPNKFETYEKIAKFFNIDVRYILGISNNLYGEDIIENMINVLTEYGSDINRGENQEYVITYNEKTHYYTDKDFYALCEKLQTDLHDAEEDTTTRFCQKHFSQENVSKTPELSTEELKLIENYRKLSEDGKTIINAKMIEELRYVR